jgi:hypothetical protein
MKARRRLHRNRVDKAAKIVAEESLADCIVRDINAAGVGIITTNEFNLPNRLELTLDGGRTYRRGRIVWRLLTRAGVQFD